MKVIDRSIMNHLLAAMTIEQLTAELTRAMEQAELSKGNTHITYTEHCNNVRNHIIRRG